MNSEVIVLSSITAVRIVKQGLERTQISQAKKEFMRACVQTHKQVTAYAAYNRA